MARSKRDQAVQKERKRFMTRRRKRLLNLIRKGHGLSYLGEVDVVIAIRDRDTGQYTTYLSDRSWRPNIDATVRATPKSKLFQSEDFEPRSTRFKRRSVRGRDQDLEDELLENVDGDVDLDAEGGGDVDLDAEGDGDTDGNGDRSRSNVIHRDARNQRPHAATTNAEHVSGINGRTTSATRSCSPLELQKISLPAMKPQRIDSIKIPAPPKRSIPATLHVCLLPRPPAALSRRDLRPYYRTPA